MRANCRLLSYNSKRQPKQINKYAYAYTSHETHTHTHTKRMYRQGSIANLCQTSEGKYKIDLLVAELTRRAAPLFAMASATEDVKFAAEPMQMSPRATSPSASTDVHVSAGHMDLADGHIPANSSADAQVLGGGVYPVNVPSALGGVMAVSGTQGQTVAGYSPGMPFTGATAATPGITFTGATPGQTHGFLPDVLSLDDTQAWAGGATQGLQGLQGGQGGHLYAGVETHMYPTIANMSSQWRRVDAADSDVLQENASLVGFGAIFSAGNDIATATLLHSGMRPGAAHVYQKCLDQTGDQIVLRAQADTCHKDTFFTPEAPHTKAIYTADSRIHTHMSQQTNISDTLSSGTDVKAMLTTGRQVSMAGNVASLNRPSVDIQSSLSTGSEIHTSPQTPAVSTTPHTPMCAQPYTPPVASPGF